MTGLIIKDLLILRKSLCSYLLMVAVYAGIAFSGAWSADIVGVLMVVVVSILPVTVFSYDKQAKWDTYGLALPVGRTRTVGARYLCVLILCVGSAVLTAAIGVALTAAGRIEEPVEFMVVCAAMGLVAVLMNAAMLPLLYKFGPERARMMFYGLMGLVFFVGWLALFPLGGLTWLKTLEAASTIEQVAAIPVIAVLAGMGLLAVSFLLSVRFYRRQEV